MRAYQIFLTISTVLTGSVLFGIAVAFSFFAFQDVYYETILRTALDGILVKTGYFFSVIILFLGVLFTLQLKSLKNTLSE
jgi:hypothetical protein